MSKVAHRKSHVGALAVVALMAGACGSSGEGPTGNGSGVIVGQAPKPGAPSSKFKLPLPADSVAEATADGVETYRAPEGFELADINDFYVKQTDNKALAGYDWCGGVPLSTTQIVRVWVKPAGTSQLRLALTEDDKGVLIAVAEDPAAAATACPPIPPAGDQPFEGSTP